MKSVAKTASQRQTLLDFARATLDDLLRVENKAELIGGKVVELPSSGWRHNIIAGKIFGGVWR